MKRFCSLVLLSWTVGGLSAIAQSVIPAGAGSYASLPPLHEGQGPQDMLSWPIYVQEGESRAIPTTDWWTDLIIAKYAGNMWAYPLVISAEEEGVNISYPTNWSDNGFALDVEFPVHIKGEVMPGLSTNDTLIGTFDGGDWTGWTVGGTAFGPAPATNTPAGQGTVSGWEGEGYANSFYDSGDGPTGSLHSTPFVIDQNYLHFLIAGGIYPTSAYVSLEVGGSEVLSATGDQTEDFKWISWDVSAYVGMTGTIHIIDNEAGTSWGHIMADQFFLSAASNNPAAKWSPLMMADDARAVDWDDWRVHWRMKQGEDRAIDVVMAHGMPFTWMNFSNASPYIVTSTNALYFDDAGSEFFTAVTNNKVGMEYMGRYWGIYAPPGTVFTRDSNDLHIAFSGADDYLVVGILTNRADLNTMETWAYARPTNTRMDWDLKPLETKVTTTWSVQAEALQGSNTNVMQGWIPHHYRITTNSLNLTTREYVCPRGVIKMGIGNTYSIDYKFDGLIPTWPEPEVLGYTTNAFDPARMDDYILRYSRNENYGADTYFGGKDLVRYARYMHFAKEIEHEKFDVLTDTIRTALTDWFTYIPGETEHYFAAYTNWPALLGFNESFYSYQFTDHHFHYGYHITAAGLLGLVDHQFVLDYEPMLRLIAKEYANWDRSETNFPFLRNFDPWHGHSYAGGFSSPIGNNQESSSEAVQSWAGLYLLGSVLGDSNLMAVGAMGYAMETEAVKEYWYDYYGWRGDMGPGVFDDNYTNTMTGICFDYGPVFATFFSGDPAWIYSIQWLPQSPFLDYTADDPVFAQYQYDQMMIQRDEWMGTNENTFTTMGIDNANNLLGYLAHFNPMYVAAEMDRLWDEDDGVATANYTPGVTYYHAHSSMLIGLKDHDHYIDLPLSTVHYNTNTATWSYMAYNPQTNFQMATVYSNGNVVGQFAIPPQELRRVTSLLPTSAVFEVLDSFPHPDETDVDRFIEEFTLVLSKPADAATANAITITGGGLTGITYRVGDGTQFLTFDLEGISYPSTTYQVDVPVSLQSTGAEALVSATSILFTTEAQPQLAVIGGLPKHKDMQISVDTTNVTVLFNARMVPSSLTNFTLEPYAGGPIVPLILNAAETPFGTQTAKFYFAHQLFYDENYSITVPASVLDISTNNLLADHEAVFATEGPELPPSVYFESFNGGSFLNQTLDTASYDPTSMDNPLEGAFSLKWIDSTENETNGYHGPTIFMYASSKEMPNYLDLSDYTHIRFSLCTGPEAQYAAWWSQGPYPDDPGIAQWIFGLTNQWQHYQLALPNPATNIDNIIGFSVQLGHELYIDNVYYVDINEPTNYTYNAGAYLRNNGILRVPIDGVATGYFMTVTNWVRITDRMIEIEEKGLGATEPIYRIVDGWDASFTGTAFAGHAFVPEGYWIDQHTNEVAMLDSNLPFQVLFSTPSNGAVNVPILETDEILLEFNRHVNAATLSGAALTGPYAEGVTYLEGDGTRYIRMSLDGLMVPGATYTVTLPTTVESTTGGESLASNTTIQFTFEPQPPLHITGSEPAHATLGVGIDLTNITIGFNAFMDKDSLTNIFLLQWGGGVSSLTLDTNIANGATQAVFHLDSGPLLRDETYSVVVGTNVHDIASNRFDTTTGVVFSTEFMPLPPGIYFDQFSGEALENYVPYIATPYLNNMDDPYEGAFCVQYVNVDTNPGSGPTISFLSSTNGEGIDLSHYTHVEFAMKISTGGQDMAWHSIGRDGAPTEVWGFFFGVSNDWGLFQLELPEVRTNVDRLVGVSVQNNHEIYLDNIRFVNTNMPSTTSAEGNAIIKDSGLVRIWIDGQEDPFISAPDWWDVRDLALDILETGAGADQDVYTLVDHTGGTISGEFATVFGMPTDYGLLYSEDLLLLINSNAPFEIFSSIPMDGDNEADLSLSTITLNFTKPVDSNTVSGITMSGVGVSGVSYLSGHDTPVLKMAVQGNLYPGAGYTVTVPTNVLSTWGGTPLASNTVITFSTPQQTNLAVTSTEPGHLTRGHPVETNELLIHFNGFMDPASFTGITLVHPIYGQVPITLDTTQTVYGGTTAVFLVDQRLLMDEYYTITVPTNVHNTSTNNLAVEGISKFSTVPGPLPPAIYFDDLSAMRIENPDPATISIDLSETNDTLDGHFSITLKNTNPTFAGDGIGPTPLFWANTNGGQGLDLSRYTHLEFGIKASTGGQTMAWYPIGQDGSPAEIAGWVTGITDEWQMKQVALPPVRTNINRLMGFSVQNNAELYLDNLRFINQNDPGTTSAGSGALIKESGVVRITINGTNGPFVTVPDWWDVEDLVVEFVETGSGATESNYTLVDFTGAAISGGMFAATYYVPDGYGIITTNETILLVQTNGAAPLTPFQQWMADNHPQLTGNDALPYADPDGDGMVNLLEFAYGTDPDDVGSMAHNYGIMLAVDSTNQFTVTYRQRQGALQQGVSNHVDGIVYVPETGSGLMQTSQWHQGILYVPGINYSNLDLPALPAGYEYRTYRNTHQPHERFRSFFRVQIHEE